MRPTETSVGGVVAIMMIFGCGALSAQHKREVSARIASIRQSAPCIDTAKVRIRPVGKVDARSACWLVGLAFQEVGRGAGRQWGILPADTAGVRTVQIGEFRFRGLLGASDEWYWLVNWTVPNRGGVEVVIEELDSTVMVRRAEGMTDHHR